MVVCIWYNVDIYIADMLDRKAKFMCLIFLIVSRSKGRKERFTCVVNINEKVYTQWSTFISVFTTMIGEQVDNMLDK